MIYDNVHEKSPKKPRTRKCTRFFGANMVLCGTIKHHNKTSNQGFTALWHVLELCKLMGYASSLSAKSSMSNIVELFFYALSGQASFMVLIVNRIPPYVVGHSFMSFYTLTSPFHTSIPSCSLPLQNKRLSLRPDNNYNKSNEQYAENY